MKTILVTGSNSGIGKEAALILATEGHRILMLCRDSEKSKRAQQDIISLSGNENIHLIPVDLSEPRSIQKAVEEIQTIAPLIDVLVNNAGVYKVKRDENSSGIELNFAVNFLATFILTHLLLKNLQASGNGRIVNVVSEIYKTGKIDFDNLMLEDGYKVGDAYANSKLAAVLYSVELAKQVKEKNITVNMLHPGILATDAFRDYPKLLVKLLNLFLENPVKGGKRIVYLATSEDLQDTTGKYFFKLEERNVGISPEDDEITRKLWQTAEDLTQLKS
jgi:NAD(P)-dependent dehydrogenase (short-subunit alcohol dehydrogenase family)